MKPADSSCDGIDRSVCAQAKTVAFKPPPPPPGSESERAPVAVGRGRRGGKVHGERCLRVQISLPVCRSSKVSGNKKGRERGGKNIALSSGKLGHFELADFSKTCFWGPVCGEKK